MQRSFQSIKMRMWLIQTTIDLSRFFPSLIEAFKNLFTANWSIFWKIAICFTIHNMISEKDDHALIDIVNRIQTNFDKGIYSCGIFIDLKKSVWHSWSLDSATKTISLRRKRHCEWLVLFLSFQPYPIDSNWTRYLQQTTYDL